MGLPCHKISGTGHRLFVSVINVGYKLLQCMFVDVGFYRPKFCSFTQIVFAKQFSITVLVACLHVFNCDENSNYTSDSVISLRKAYCTYFVISDQYVCRTQRAFRCTTNSYTFRLFNQAIVRLYGNERKMSLICDKCHNSKFITLQEKLLKVLKCYNFLWVHRRLNCSPAASFANCVMILYLLKVYLQTFLSVPITQKCQILSCDTIVANERHDLIWNANLMQQGNFINVFLARHVSDIYAHHQEH